MEVLDRHQLLELQALGYKPGKKPNITLEDILCVLPSELDKDGNHSNLTLTAPDKQHIERWVCGYHSYDVKKMAHWYYEAETPLDAAYALLKGFIMRYGTEQLNKL